MHRRALLATGATALGGGLAGCARLTGRRDVRMDSGHATLQPATERPIADGLQPDGDDRLATWVVADEAPALIGADATTTIVDTLRNKGSKPQFHVVVQLRSQPEAPKEIWPVAGDAFGWADRSTLRARAEVGPWGRLDRIDDPDRRERLRSAQSLVYTGVWTLRPAPDPLPREIILETEQRERQQPG